MPISAPQPLTLAHRQATRTHAPDPHIRPTVAPIVYRGAHGEIPHPGCNYRTSSDDAHGDHVAHACHLPRPTVHVPAWITPAMVDALARDMAEGDRYPAAPGRVLDLTLRAYAPAPCDLPGRTVARQRSDWATLTRLASAVGFDVRDGDDRDRFHLLATVNAHEHHGARLVFHHA